MAMVIHKYQIDPPSPFEFTVVMPLNANTLDLQMQDDSPCIWAEIDKEEVMTKVRFRWVPTGNSNVPDEGFYVGTLQFDDGQYVYHLYNLGAVV